MSDTHGVTVSVPPEWIEELTACEAIRKRPWMFVGDVGHRGLHTMVDDILTHSLLSRASKSITLVLKADNSLRITDNGDPFAISLERFLTKLPAPGGPIFAFAIANALSEWLQIEGAVQGNRLLQEFHAGVPLGPASVIEGDCGSGMVVALKPDRKIFSDTQFSSPAIRSRLEELAFLHSGVGLSFEDDTTETSEPFLFEDGIRALIEKLNQRRTPLHDVVVIRGEESGITFEVGIQFCKEREEIIQSYVNDRFCPDDGTHVTGVRNGLTRSAKRIAKTKWRTKDSGLTAVVSIRMESPQFLGSRQTKLGNPEAQRILAAQVKHHITDFFMANPATADAIIQPSSHKPS